MRKLLLLFSLNIIFIAPVKSQDLYNPVPALYNTAMQRLLIIATGYFIYGSKQGHIDTENAIIFAAKIFGRTGSPDSELQINNA